MAPFLVAAWLLAASAIWAGRLILAPSPLAGGAGILIGLDLVVLGAVGAIGLVMTHGRWARRLGLAVLGGQAVAAIVLDFTGWSVIGLGFTTGGLILWAGPALTGWLRRLPSSEAPPTRAIVLALVLLALPAVSGAAAPTGPGPGHWALAAAGVLTAWAYGRATQTGLWAARIVVPALTLAVAFTSPLAGGIVLAGIGAVVTVLAWHRDASLAVMDLLPRPGGGVAVPARLVPSDVLRAVGYDEDGRRRGPG